VLLEGGLGGGLRTISVNETKPNVPRGDRVTGKWQRGTFGSLGKEGGGRWGLLENSVTLMGGCGEVRGTGKKRREGSA